VRERPRHAGALAPPTGRGCISLACGVSFRFRIRQGVHCDEIASRLGRRRRACRNTLFIITVEEGDHFVGSKPSPANCDGVTTPCTYSQIGEVDVFLNSVLKVQTGNTTPFDVHFDMAPAVCVHNNPDPEDPSVRQLELDIAKLNVVDPWLNRVVPLITSQIDRNAMKLLHMITADPLRTPTFVPFAYPDFYVETTTANLDCNQSPTSCVFQVTDPTQIFAWNHGGITSQIATTWLGLVGPGIRKIGIETASWTDHVDIRPTMLSLAGLQDSYLHDGRPLAEYLNPTVPPPSVTQNLTAFANLAEAYKQLNAPFGATGQAAITFATAGVTTTNPTAQDLFVYHRNADHLTEEVHDLPGSR
jgi:hypothetical protein